MYSKIAAFILLSTKSAAAAKTKQNNQISELRTRTQKFFKEFMKEILVNMTFENIVENLLNGALFPDQFIKWIEVTKYPYF